MYYKPIVKVTCEGLLRVYVYNQMKVCVGGRRTYTKRTKLPLSYFSSPSVLRFKEKKKTTRDSSVVSTQLWVI